MAHPAQLSFVALAKKYFLPEEKIRVLEVGSYDVNGGIRGRFQGADYVGADLAEGPGVDVVGSGHELSFPEGSFDLALSCECFEHNPYWAETFLNMHRMVKPGGLVVVTCASKGRGEHGTARTSPEASPGTFAVGIDYYRNLNARDFKRRFDLGALFQKQAFYYLAESQDLYFVGWKKGGAEAPPDLSAFGGEVRAIAQSLPRPPLPFRALRFLYRLPAWLVMQLCEDPTYQNFQLAYVRLARPFKAFFGLKAG
jgi:SAM-dependent methyltransferase